MQLSVDDQKTQVFVKLECKAHQLKEEQAKLEKAEQKAQETYHTAKLAAVQGQAGWEGVGTAHIEWMKLTTEREKTANAYTAANNELSNARHVMIEELLRAARAAVPQ